MLITEVMRYLDSRGVVTYDASGISGNVFFGLLPTSPDIAVAILPSGGRSSSIKHSYDNPTFQVLVRGTRDPRTGYEKALEVYDALHGFSGGPFVDGGYWVVKCQGVQSEPVHIGQDENGRHRYSLNFWAEINRPTIYRI